jgi:hypothetical protein
LQALRSAPSSSAARSSPAPADAIATLLGAVGDGLLLHARLDPGLDVHGALRTLLAPRPT